MTCTKRNCPQCATVVHTEPAQPQPVVVPTPETNGPSHYEDAGSTRAGYWYTD